jgi:hypothetical protein
MNIQKMAAVLLLVVLVITMIIVYAMLYYSNNELKYPPIISKCPDKISLVSGKCGGTPSFEPYEGGDVCEYKESYSSTTHGNWDGISNADCD